MGEIASAHVSIYPKFSSGFGSQVKSEVGAAGAAGGTAFVGGFNKTGVTGVKTSLAGVKAGIVGIVASATLGSAVSGFQELTGAASDLNETVNKSKVIFGDGFAAIDVWATGAAETMGLSRQAALESASSFANMFQQLGFAGDAAASMSQQVVQMSADMGSFNNLPTADVADRISAAFRGEYDSLQLLIPNINAARVEQEALAMTGKESAKQLTAQEKAAAVLSIVQKDAANQMGDYAATAEQAANRQKTLSAETENLKGRFGGLLQPVQELALNGFEKLIEAGKGFTGWLEQNPAVMDGFTVALEMAGGALQMVGTTIAGVAVPALAILTEGFAQALDAIAWFLDALGNIPGFEWANDAADRVRTIADGAHVAAEGLEGLTGQIYGTGDSAATADGQVQGLNGEIASIPPSAQTEISAPGATTAAAQAASFRDIVNSIPESKKVTVYYQTSGFSGGGGASGVGGGGWADGGIIPGFDGGGTIPGVSPHSRADDKLIWATSGEFMQPVSSVRWYGVDAMEAVRTKRATISYADGGSVGGMSGVGGALIDKEALRDAVRLGVSDALDGRELDLVDRGDVLSERVAARIVRAVKVAV